MKISVVIPTYNRPSLLNVCLKCLSIQALYYCDYEVIVVTDGPDTNTQQLVDHLAFTNPDMQIRMISLQERSGPAAARNAGWKAAQTQLIAFTDDDTQPDKNWLLAFVSAYNNEQQIAYTGRVIVPLHSRPTDYEQNTAHLETAEFVTANCMCTKAALESVSGFDEQYKMAWREDSDLHFKLLHQNIPVLRCDSAVVVHPARQAPWGVSLKEQRKSMYNALLYKKFPVLYRQKVMSSPLWSYYVIVIGFIVSIILLINGYYAACICGLLLCFTLIVAFAMRRLKFTSRAWSHVAEMLITSALIPFLSVFWTVYGAVRFRVFYL